jgi:chromosome segregation ATPase
MKNKLNAELAAKVEKLMLDNEELKSEIQTLENHKKRWEKGLNEMREYAGQAEYLSQVEQELWEKKEQISRLTKEIADYQRNHEEEMQTLKEDIEGLQMKNLELIKYESMMGMYKKKLDDLKDIKQSKWALELERDALKNELDQERIHSRSSKEDKKAIEFYKSKLEESKSKIMEFEMAIKDKNHEIVKLKNAQSKLNREMNMKDEKLKFLESQLGDMIDKSEDCSDDLKKKILVLESQIEILNKQEHMSDIKFSLIESEVCCEFNIFRKIKETLNWN